MLYATFKTQDHFMKIFLKLLKPFYWTVIRPSPYREIRRHPCFAQRLPVTDSPLSFLLTP